MNHALLRGVVSALLLAVSPAATAPPIVARTFEAMRQPQTGGDDRAVPFTVGESLTYDVTWADLLTAGTATVTVRERRPSFDAIAWYIVAEGRPAPLLARIYPLYYKVDTLLETRTLLPQRGSVFSQERDRRRMKETRFDQQARRATFELTTSTTVREEQRLPGPTQDALSAIYVLRTIRLAAGETMQFAVADSGELYTVTARVSGRETVTTGLGPIAAWKVVPEVADAQGEPFGEGLAVWISDDPRRLPVKLQAILPVGSFTLTLAGT